MEWFYSDGKTQFGPVDEAEFERLQRIGTITSQTLVWNQTLPNWMAWGQVNPVPASPSHSGTYSGVAESSAWGPPRGQFACSVCGRHFPEGDLLRYESSLICAECKPAYFQRLREGAFFSGELVYAGFWVRFVAKFIDGVLLGIVNQIVSIGLTALWGDIESLAPGDFAALSVILGVSFFVPLVLGFAYSVYFHGKHGATPGKMAMKIRVVMADGTPLNYGVAAGRWFATSLSYITFYIGFIMAGFDNEKRALHDRVCNTRVIRAN